MSEDTSDDDGSRGPPPKQDYEVGYKKPPVRTQFKKGQVGNPKGRPKKTRLDLRVEFENISGETTAASKNGRTKHYSRLELAVRRQVADGLKGNTRDTRALFNRALKHGFVEKLIQKSFIEITEPDGEFGAMLRAYHVSKKTLS